MIGDLVGLELVFENLIGNAIKYRSCERPRIRIDAEHSATGWTVRVRDNGTGIPTAIVDQVFEPFVRGGVSVPGHGLGLATCRRIIERLGGRIWVELSTETGTVIAFTLAAPDDLPHASASELTVISGGAG